MAKSAAILLVYGLLIFVGGIMGYTQAKSLLSLIIGCGFGLLLLGAALALYKKKRASVWISISLVLLLDAFFTYRFIQTMRFFPSGLFMLLSLATLVILVMQLRKGRSR